MKITNMKHITIAMCSNRRMTFGAKTIQSTIFGGVNSFYSHTVPKQFGNLRSIGRYNKNASMRTRAVEALPLRMYKMAR